MSFLNPGQLSELENFAFVADKEARSDLARGFIRNEDDYTSNFTGALRRIINSNSSTGLTATSFLLTPSEERAVGTDAAIILSNNSESKVALFEAKWPRFGTPGYQWDYPQTASGFSHYSDQIERQRNRDGDFAIFEMFYCESQFGAQPAFLQDEVSSCVWHADAQNFRALRRAPDAIWTQDDLRTMITDHRLNIREVMRDFGRCLKGKPLRMTDPEAMAAEFRLPNRILAIKGTSEKHERVKR